MIGVRGMRSLLLVGIGAAVLFLALTVSTRSGLGWLARSDAAWIVYPHVVRTTAYSDRPLEAVFETQIDLAQGGEVAVELDCLGRCAVEIAGRPVEQGAVRLPAGSHLVALRAQRGEGPPAAWLQLRAGLDGPVIARTDSTWLASLSGAVRLPAAVASVPRRPEPSPLPAVPWSQVVVLGFVSVAMVLVAEWRGARWGRALLPLILLAWIGLFVANTRSLPGLIGFDVEHHLAYLKFVMSHWAIPSPSDGVQTYQPPLYYLISAGWLDALGLWPDRSGSVPALRALGVLLGLFHVIGLYACVRLVLPGREGAAALALVFAAALPLHLTLFHSFSNEVLVAALSTATVWALLWSLQEEVPTARQGLAVGLLAGAALLAKLSALVLLPVVLGALWLRSPRAAAPWWCLFGVLLVAGWYYARVAAEFGTPFVGNWDSRVGFIWWQDPGFRVPAAYLHFGRALFDPWFAGFDSVWDGFYSTLFADGLASGEANRLLGPAWNHGLARVAVWLALVPAGLVVLGGVRAVRAVWHRPDARGLALAGLAVVMGTAFVFMTLRVPSYAQAKASYLTPALVILVLAFALGVDTVRSRSLWGGRLATVGLILWAVVSYAVFWIDPNAAATLHSGGERELARGRPAAARALFDRVKATEEGQAPVWVAVGRCRSLAQEGRVRRAISLCEAGLAQAPDDPDALFHTASLARRRGELERAFALFERLRAVAPLDARGPPAVASLARRLGHPERAERAAREWLRFDPGNPRALAILPHRQAGSEDGS